MSAALTARARGASVLMIESANKDLRGGNSRHVRNIRYTHNAATDFVTGRYDADEYFKDLMRVTDGNTNEELMRFMIDASEDCADWMLAQGIKFRAPLSGTLGLARTNAFFLGGGRAMMNSYFKAAEKAGIDIVYEAEVESIEMDGAKFTAAMGSLLAVHLGIVLAMFATFPFGKMAHAVYRLGALIKFAHERRSG